MAFSSSLNESILQFSQNFLKLPNTVNQFYIALSGGLDSCILLHVAQKLVPSKKLVAIHVNHEIEAESFFWEKHCKTICEKLEIPLIIHRVGTLLKSYTHLKNSAGPEDAARKARYAVFKKTLKPNNCLLTAHHLEDQAETLIIQLIRSAGVRGLSGMPMLQHKEDIYYFRPLLTWSRENRLEYARENQLQWVEDPSNLNERFTRNFIRRQVLPVLQKRWPSVTRSLAKTAEHCAQTLELCNELAKSDLNIVAHPVHRNQLLIKQLCALSFHRRVNVLRFWLKTVVEISMSTVQFQFLEKLLHTEKPYQTFSLKNISFQKYQEYLHAFPEDSIAKVPLTKLVWNINTPLLIPNYGTLTGVLVKGRGIRCSLFSHTDVLDIRFRSGRERFHPQERIGSHPLKKLFQEWKVLPWKRDTVPLIYLEDKLLAVADYSISKTAFAHPDELGLSISIIT